jgi:plastocyanin
MRQRWIRNVFLVLTGVFVAAACSSSGSGKASDTNSGGGASTTVPEVTPATPIVANTVPEGAERIQLRQGPFPIGPGTNSIGFTRTIPQPEVDGWIVGISTDLKLKDGTVPPVDKIHLHHGVWVNLAAKDATDPSLPERFFAAGEEKTRVILPPGYGYEYKTSDKWLLNYMLHNNLSEPDEVWVTYDIDLIPKSSAAAKGIKPAIPVWMDVQNGSTYPVFDVELGSGQNGEYTYPDDAENPYPNGKKLNEWTVPFDGKLLATAGHLHPGGLHNDLWLARAGESEKAHLFSSIATYYEPAGPVSWDLSMSATPEDWSVALKKGDTLSTTVTYETKQAAWYESMGIMVAWMAVGDTTGDDPFATDVAVQGVLTHGHLPENDNHGGEPDPDYQDLTKQPSREVPSGTVLPIADFVYVGDMLDAQTVPAVKEGGALVYRNDDDKAEIPHTVTSCEAPCNKSSGIAYPLANGKPAFDSGEMGTFGLPANGSQTWSTPDDLPPGTYTYFCRIHTGMRGAFRVLEVDS